jgi:hypothetical protein
LFFRGGGAGYFPIYTKLTGGEEFLQFFPLFFRASDAMAESGIKDFDSAQSPSGFPGSAREGGANAGENFKFHRAVSQENTTEKTNLGH